MSQFILLIRNEGIAMSNLSQEEIDAHMNDWGAWMGGLQEEGKLEGGMPFSAESAAVIGANGNNVSNSFHSEANNLNVGGYIVLNANSLDEAIAIAKNCPALQNDTSTVEVRECVDMTPA